MGLERNPSWPWGRTPLCCQRPWENGQKQVLLLWKSTFSIIKIDSHTDQHSFFLCSTTMWLWVWLWTNWLQIVLPSNHIPLLFSILIRALMLGKMTVLHVWLTGDLWKDWHEGLFLDHSTSSKCQNHWWSLRGESTSMKESSHCLIVFMQSLLFPSFQFTQWCVWLIYWSDCSSTWCNRVRPKTQEGGLINCRQQD